MIRLSLILVLLLAAPVHAKDLYVDGSDAGCSDSVTYANNADSANNRWCTIGRAAWGSTDRAAPVTAQAAAAGDTVYVAAGIYTGPGTAIRYNPTFNPVNEGTSSAQLTFQGVGTVELRLSSSTGPVIGANDRDYITWKNFYIDEAYAVSVRDTGSVVLWSTIGSTIEDCTIDGNGTVVEIDNHTGIRLEATRDIVIRNNTIHDVYSNTSSSHNGAGVMLYDTENALIENNYIYNTGAGIYVKGDHDNDGWPQQNNTIRYNVFEANTSKGVYAYSAKGTKVYQNIFLGNPSNFRFSGNAPNTDVYFVNNTVVDSLETSSDHGFGVEGQGPPEGHNTIIHNNIFAGPLGEAINMGDISSIGDQSFEHNVYYGFDTFGSLNLATMSFATWQSTHGQDSASPAGINQDPLFTNAGTGDYTLQSGSPALTLGRTITAIHGTSGSTIPAGAYITGDETIGLLSGTEVCSPQYRNLCDVSNCETTGEGYWYNDTCNATAQGTLVNGTCGSNNNATLASLTSANVDNCATGTVDTFSGTGPWTWNCAGSNGGTTASCSASLQAVGGGTGRAPYSATARVPYSATKFARYYEANP